MKNHPYEVPEVIGMPITVGSKKYVDWVIESTKTAGAESSSATETENKSK